MPLTVGYCIGAALLVIFAAGVAWLLSRAPKAKRQSFPDPYAEQFGDEP